MKNKKKIMPLKSKIMFVLIPVMIIAFAIVFVTTYLNTRNILEDHITAEAEEIATSVCNDVLVDLNRTIGIIQNIKASVERGCETEEEIQEYIYSVADAYPETIPNGIYCGLESGIYIDKLWTPGDDWIMKERPWYVEGLVADDITMGEMYIDADSGAYIISVYTNIKDAAGNVIGVISADVPMDTIVEVIENKEILDNTRFYGVDSYTGLIFGDRTKTEEFNLYESASEDDVNVVKMIENQQFDSAVKCGDNYFIVKAIEGTNFYLVYEIPAKVFRTDLDQVRNISCLSSAFGIVIICIAIFITVALFLKPIKKLEDHIIKMSTLNLTGASVINTNDELGEMSRALNEMSSNLKTMVENIKNDIIEIDENAKHNFDTAGFLLNSSNEQCQSVDELTSTMNEMKNAIEMIAEGATELANTVSETGVSIKNADEIISGTRSQIEGGYAAMNNMSDTMGTITDVSDSLKKAVADVQAGVEGITEMVTVINGIAAQTNLLSLNASIEAARAGDAGRGFAVVAEEIRMLSENCAVSVSTIKETTENIKALVQVVLEKTDQSVSAVRLGGEAVNQTQEIFGNISSDIENIGQVMGEVDTAFKGVEKVVCNVAASTKQQTASSTLVLDASNQVRELSQQFNANGNEINEQAGLLKKLSDDLDEKIGMFTL